MDLPLADREIAASLFPGPYSSASNAIATTIDKELLRPFKQCLVDIEAKILNRDSAYVGGEHQVALSKIAAETVRKWERRFIYSRTLLEFITKMPPQSDRAERRQPYPHELIDKLRKDEAVGYEDLKELVHNCLISVERTWLAQVSSWILYGRLPRKSAMEFMIARVATTDTPQQHSSQFILRESFMPSAFMNSTIGNNVFIIGQCLFQMKAFSQNISRGVDGKASFDLDTIAEHSKLLFSTKLPISENEFHRKIAAIKTSVFKNIVKNMLPIPNIQQLFALLRRIALAGSFEFTDCFLSNIELERSKGTTANFEALSFDSGRIFRRALAEFTEDSSSQSDRDLYEITSRLVSYNIVDESRQSAHSGQFDDLLLGLRCKLSIKIDWPLYILVTERESELYGALFSYFMAIKNTIRNLKDLWKEFRNDPNRASRAPIASKAKVFLDNFWNYLQSNVVDPNFDELLTTIAVGAENQQVDPQTITACHEKIIKNIYLHSFIGDMKMRTYLRKLLILCNALCGPIEHDFSNDSRISILIDNIQIYLGQQEIITPAINQLILRLDTTTIS
ncbi:hypothetical protein AWJ20_1719 [Sugiyamaella lignohabitans]|uniref:Spindle pole body component n=1 Tax=Sugiyamaella lignohabitans TaxID=796027 RepID=A0A167DXX6_9ASCO|nr:uncharacterized protein AWJ20_1719 [Sugiyamaella lignohabitans]ANB13428.1 hypothetical protein AWJ20_1719 [Sugiyamaella lignohabitans]